MQNIYEAVTANKRRSLFVVLGFFVFISMAFYFISQGMISYFGYQPGGLGSVGLALVISGLLSFVSYYFSDRIVLSISGAKLANRKDHFEFYTVAENLCIATGLPKAKLYVINDSAPNAFATGRDPKNAVICATTGLLEKLNRSELEGVVGHEISHIRNYDMRLMSVVAVLVGTVALLADWFLRMQWWGGKDRNKNESSQLSTIFLILGIVFAVISPIIANLIKLAISRRREFLADAGSVSITKQPNGLISALKKISDDKEPLEVANKATAHLYFESPFEGKVTGAVGKMSKLFNTHPPVIERIAALEKML